MLDLRSDFLSEDGGSSRRPVTMTDVAKRAGVHQTTVSIALRNHPSIPEATRQRIQRLAREMGYRKDPELEAFNRYRLGRQGTQPGQQIAFLTDAADEAAFFSDPNLAAYFNGALARAAELKVSLRLVLIDGEEGSSGLAERLRAAGANALIVGSLARGRDVPLRWADWVAVGIDTFSLESTLDLVAPDYRRAARMAVARLCDQGCQRIGYLAPRAMDQSLGNLCQVGYLLEARLRNLPILQRTRGRATWDETSVAQWVLEDDLDSVVSLEAASVAMVEKASAAVGRSLTVTTLDSGAGITAVAGVDLRRERVGAAAIDGVLDKANSGWLRVGVAPTVTFLAVDWLEAGAVKSDEVASAVEA